MTSIAWADQLPFFPNFFLVGAPRCGTTSISKYLSWHPEVCFSRPKELHYFNRDWRLDAESLHHGYLDRYFPHFDPARHRAVGEGSVSYLYEPEAIRRILAIQPEARFLVTLRNPIDMIRSYHWRLLFLLEEDQPDFAIAWDLQDLRRRGERVPPLCRDPRLLQYREIASLGTHLAALFEVAGRERCRVVVADDLRCEPEAVYRELFRFLGISEDLEAVATASGQRGFPQGHRGKTYRWRWLHRILFKPPAILFPAAERRELSRSVRPSRVKQLHKRLVRFNRIKADPPPLSSELRARLGTELSEEIRLLEGLLGRDLGEWR